MTINLGRIALFLCLIFLVPPLGTSAAWAASYYVSPSGNDSNVGTSTSAPFRTIQRSLNSVRPGDTVNIMAGTYYEGLVLMTSGTRTARITLKNYAGASVTVNSGNQRAIRLNAVIGYYTIDGITFISNYVGNYVGNSDYSIDLGVGGPGWWGYGYPVDSAAAVDDDSNGHNGFIVQNCTITGSIGFQGHNNIVRNCKLNGNNAFKNGIFDFTVVSHKNLYTQNTITRYRDRGVWSMSNTYEITVSYNDISHWGAGANPAAIDFDGAWLPVYNSVIANNVIHDGDGNNSMGMQFENGMNCICENNTIYNVLHGMTIINYTKDGQGTYGFGIHNFQVQDPNNLILGKIPYVTNNVLRNNIVYNASLTGALVNMSWGNYVYNNTFDVPGSWGAILLANGGTSTGSANTTVTNNIITNSSRGLVLESGSSLRSATNNLFYANSSNGTMGSAAQTGDPKFTNRSGRIYTLASGSAAIDKGATVSSVTVDAAGNARPQGSAYDIGAYEFVSATPTPTPSPTPTDPIIPHSGWTLRYVDSQETAGENGVAQNAFDGNPATFWMTQWSPWGSTAAPLPHEIQIDLGNRYTLTRVRYLPRQDEWLNGNIQTAEIYVSEDGVNWGAPVAQPSFTYSFDSNGKAKEMDVIFPATLGRMIRIRALTEVNGNPWTSIAEINAFGVPVAPTPTPTPTATPTATPTVVSITSPAAGASIKGIIPILATVADGSSVTEVEFYLDGAPLGSDSSPPYAFSWSTVSTASGIHVLTAKAYHAAAGPSASNPVTVVLRRVPKAPTITLLK